MPRVLSFTSQMTPLTAPLSNSAFVCMYSTYVHTVRMCVLFVQNVCNTCCMHSMYAIRAVCTVCMQYVLYVQYAYNRCCMYSIYAIVFTCVYCLLVNEFGCVC